MTEKEWGIIIAIYLSAIGVFGTMMKLFGNKKNCVTKKECVDARNTDRELMETKLKGSTRLILSEIRIIQTHITGKPAKPIEMEDIDI